MLEEARAIWRWPISQFKVFTGQLRKGCFPEFLYDDCSNLGFCSWSKNFGSPLMKIPSATP